MGLREIFYPKEPVWLVDWRFKDFEEYLDNQLARLTEETPKRWALLLEKYFSSRKNEEGKILAKKRTRRKKNVTNSESQGGRSDSNYSGEG